LQLFIINTFDKMPQNQKQVNLALMVLSGFFHLYKLCAGLLVVYPLIPLFLCECVRCPGQCLWLAAPGPQVNPLGATTGLSVYEGLMEGVYGCGVGDASPSKASQEKVGV